jgi:hypothetical protein
METRNITTSLLLRGRWRLKPAAMQEVDHQESHRRSVRCLSWWCQVRVKLGSMRTPCADVTEMRSPKFTIYRAGGTGLAPAPCGCGGCGAASHIVLYCPIMPIIPVPSRGYSPTQFRFIALLPPPPCCLCATVCTSHFNVSGRRVLQNEH